MRKQITALAIIVLTAAGCGGSEDNSEPAAAALTPTTMAEKIGCTFQPEAGQTELFVKEQGECDLAGQSLRLYTFSDAGTRDSWLKAAKAFGGNYAAGERWVVAGDSASPVAAAADKLGGKVQ